MTQDDAVGRGALFRQGAERRTERADLIFFEVPLASVGLDRKSVV